MNLQNSLKILLYGHFLNNRWQKITILLEIPPFITKWHAELQCSSLRRSYYKICSMKNKQNGG